MIPPPQNYSQQSPCVCRHGLEMIELRHFRHARLFTLDTQGESVLLGGANGMGKTNILEAVSLLSPGRGVRQAQVDQFLHWDIPKSQGWQITAKLCSHVGGYVIKTRWQEGQSGRAAFIEDNKVSQQQLVQFCKTLSLGPRDDQIFLMGAEGLRRFCDRLIAVFDPAHIGRVQAQRQLQRQWRELLEKGQRIDEKWIVAIERQLAAKMVAVSAARRQHAIALAQTLQQNVADFIPNGFSRKTFWSLELTGKLQQLFAHMPAIEVEEKTEQLLKENRARMEVSSLQDQWQIFLMHHKHQTGNISQNDQNIGYAPHPIAVSLLSHGQQKMALLALILAQAWQMRHNLAIVPILLLDEALSHLDERHQEILFDHLARLQCQYWISGVEVKHAQSFAPTARVIILESQNPIDKKTGENQNV